MKNTVYSFKMLSLLIVLAFSNYSMAQEVSLKKQDVKTKEKITTHFSGHLSGNADAYDDKSRLKSTDVKKMLQIVCFRPDKSIQSNRISLSLSRYW